MSKLLVVILASISLSSMAADKESKVFDIIIKNGNISESIQLVNGFCGSDTGILIVKNPSKKLPLKFEGVSCLQAVKLLKDYDFREA